MKTNLPLSDALALASKYKAMLAPACECIEIAGSIRRRKPTVGDIELVCIPMRQPDLFGDPGASLLDMIINEILQAGIVQQLKGGDRFKQFMLPEGLTLDLFISDPERFWPNFVIRTGPKEFSQKIVTKRKDGGLMPSHLKFKDLGWHDDTGRVFFLSEQNVFELLGLDWIEPWKRK